MIFHPQVDGKPTDYAALATVLKTVATEICKASTERDRLKKEKIKRTL